MFKSYKDVIETLQFKNIAENIFQLDDKHTLVLLPLVQKPLVIIRIKKHDRFINLLNTMDYALIEHPEQLYHMLKIIKAKLY